MKYIYMTVDSDPRASTTTLSYETDPVPDEWEFVCLTMMNSEMWMIFRKEAE